LGESERGDINMDKFDVLQAVTTRKTEFVLKGMKENRALNKAETEISKEYHILLNDIRKLYRPSY
jgi:hypothetical protein